MTRISSFFSPLATLSLMCLCAAPVATANYTFINIVDNTGPLGVFGTPKINNAGTVAFRAEIDTGGEGIFTGNGSELTTIADTSGSFSDLDNDGMSINAVGTVAFHASLDSGGAGVFVGSRNGIATIATSSGPFAGVNPITPINDSGTVAFRGAPDGGVSSIFTISGERVTTITSVSGFLDGLNGLWMNNAGTVAFRASFFGGNGIYTGNGGPLTTIADTFGSFSNFPGSPDITDGNVVIFSAILDAGGSGIFISAGGTVTPVVNTSGPFSAFLGENPAINSMGEIAFRASLDVGGSGIFTGDDPVADKVIRSGDPLFGSIVSALGFYQGLNDNGDVAFSYTLTSGVSGVAVAQPNRPTEPSDLNGDGDVDGFDLAAMILGAWGPCPGCTADLDGNGVVNGFDLAMLLGAWS